VNDDVYVNIGQYYHLSHGLIFQLAFSWYFTSNWKIQFVFCTNSASSQLLHTDKLFWLDYLKVDWEHHFL
jgi:hypothetical protein